MKLILKQTAVLVAMGIAIGLALSLGRTRVVQSLLYDVGVSDPVSCIGAAIVLLAAATLAVASPARRATHVDPTAALRYA